jgi:uncharacterized protein with PIN domain
MLGRLARWLRIIGQDVTYGPHLSGATLVRAARREQRVILTRDTRLLRRRDLPPHLFITSDHFREQLCQVVSMFDLEPAAAMLTRCLDCNEELCEADPMRVRPRVPPYVWETQDRFVTCPCCHRIFWGATHLERMRDELARIGILSPGNIPTAEPRG